MYRCGSSSDDKMGLGRDIKMISLDLVLEELGSSDGIPFFFAFRFCLGVFRFLIAFLRSLLYSFSPLVNW